MTTYYKVLEDGRSCHGGDLQWSLPRQENGAWIPGDWHTVDGPLILCQNGLHLTTRPDAWLTWTGTIYEAEGRDPGETDGDKKVFRSARLLREVPAPARWQAVHHFVEQEIPGVRWLQPSGPPDPTWHLTTGPSWDAARDAARDAAVDAALDAARAPVWEAAWNAAGAAARTAAWNAAEAAARDAAWNAAEAAAWAAARNATRNAAGDAAGDAAEDAARDAALMAQMVICQDLPVAERHRAHAVARWQVWTRGYALLCDVEGRLYVYAPTEDRR